MTTDATPDTGTSTGTTDAAATTTTTAAPATSAPPAGTTENTAPAAADTGAASAAAGATPAAETPPAGKDWATLRTEFAKGDEKMEKRLARYSSVEAALDALVAAQNKIASGALKTALPKDATPEQLTEWRTENGIPEAPEGYELTLPDGRVLGEADQPIVDGFLKKAHESNMSPAQVQETVAWYLAEQDRQLEARHQQDAQFRQEAEEKLRQEWGSEYKLNVNLISGLLDGAPEGVKDMMLGARLADGTPLGDHPGVLRWMANMAREVNPTATVVPGSGGNAAQAIESELASITKLMGDKKSDYWKGPNAEKMQARYRELITVKQKIS